MAQVNYGIDYYIDGIDEGQSSGDILRVYYSNVSADGPWTQFGSDVGGCTPFVDCSGDIQFQYQFGDGLPQYLSLIHI